jgi:predicted enzyme related to lactoylglutathione lyase
MAPTLTTVIYPVTDLAHATTTFRALLDADPVMDTPSYVQFHADGHEIGLDPNGARKGMTGPLAYWHVDDIHGTLARLLSAGATEQQAVTDVGGRLIATVTAGDGAVIGLLQNP